MTDLFQEPDDATPLEPSEREGLLQSWVTHRRDLNEVEQANILKGSQWARRRRGADPTNILNGDFVRQLHTRMFKDVWRWAGTYRQTERNIGIEAYNIAPEVEKLLMDAKCWIEYDSYSADEIAVRFHHRLVAIHPFPNGNGRHARLMADLLVEKLGQAPFSWGGTSLTDVSELRSRYIQALRSADDYDIEPLLHFARS